MLLEYKGPPNKRLVCGKEYPVTYFFLKEEKGCEVQNFGILEDMELNYLMYYGKSHLPRSSAVSMAKKEDLVRLNDFFVVPDDVWEVTDSYIPKTWTLERGKDGRLLKGYPFKDEEEWARLDGVLFIGPPECESPTVKDSLRYRKAIMGTYYEIVEHAKSKPKESSKDLEP
jgi:hypothetical protein